MAAKRRRRGSGSLEQLPSGRWRGRYWNLAGTKLLSTPSTSRRSDAETLLRRAIVDQERDGLELAPRTMTLATMIDLWWPVAEGSMKPRAAERYDDHLTHIRRLLGTVPLRDLDYARVQQFVAELQAVPLAPKTVRGCYAVLALVLEHAQRLGKMQRAIPKPILPRVPKPVLTVPSRDDVERLALASDARLWAPLLLAGYCGLREGELLALGRTDVHLDPVQVGGELLLPHVLVRVARNKTTGQHEETKTSQIRRVYLPERVLAALREHLGEYPGDLVCPVSASVLQKSFERARRTCGLDGVRPHDLRHAAASMMIAAGLNVLQVSKQLGHADAAITLRVYGHLWPDAMGEAMQRMNAYLAA